MSAMPSTLPRAGQPAPLDVILDQFPTILAEQAAADDRGWAGAMWYALARLEKELQQHIEDLKAPDGLEAEVDQTRPTLVRQQEKLQQDYQNHLEQCLALKWETYRLAQPLLDAEPEALGKAAPASGDPQTLRERLQQFVTQLQAYQQTEAGLILESVTTDLGAGD